MILAIINNKGGTGKTTTAVNLAASLAKHHKRRTLLVDLDSQASASLSLGIARADFSPSVADAILEGKPLATAVRKTAIEGLDIAAGSPDLVNADLTLADVRGRERRLADALRPIQKDYDFIVLDCPPSLSMLSINALVAGDAFLVPTPPEYLALEGLVGLMTAVDRIHEGIGDKCNLMGIVMTKVDRRRRVTEEIIDIIRGHYKGHVLKSEIRTDVRLVEAPSFGKDIFDYAGGSAGAEGYGQLASEIIAITKKGRGT